MAVVDETHWGEIFKLNCAVVDVLGVPDTNDNRAAAHIVCDHWIFPMYGLDLKPQKVAVAELRQTRQKHMNMLEREFYGDVY